MVNQVWWEVQYDNGIVVSQARGAKYENIDRTNLASFTLFVAGFGAVVQLAPEGDRHGHNLVYRKRNVWLDKTAKAVHVLGWVPQGPLFAVNEEGELVDQANTFIFGHPVFYPPIAHASERWYMRGQQTRIINPVHERID